MTAFINSDRSTDTKGKTFSGVLKTYWVIRFFLISSDRDQIKNLKCDKTQQVKIWQNSKTLNVTKKTQKLKM